MAQAVISDEKGPVPLGSVVDRLDRVRGNLRARGIFAMVCLWATGWGVDVDDLLGLGRAPPLLRARAAVYAELVRKRWSIHEIALAFETTGGTVTKRLALDARTEAAPLPMPPRPPSTPALDARRKPV